MSINCHATVQKSNKICFIKMHANLDNLFCLFLTFTSSALWWANKISSALQTKQNYLQYLALLWSNKFKL